MASTVLIAQHVLGGKSADFCVGWFSGFCSRITSQKRDNALGHGLGSSFSDCTIFQPIYGKSLLSILPFEL